MQKPKFRVWDTVEKQWYPEDNIAIDNLGNTFVFGLNTDRVDDYGREIFEIAMVENSDKQIIEPFTEMYDKERKEVYRGDILLHEDGYSGFVMSRFGSFCIRLPDGTFTAITDRWSVIGNIHENTDLLNK